MIPSADFPESNTHFTKPKELDESQCLDIKAFVGSVEGGSMDGTPIIVLAWQPNEQEIDRINQGSPVYLSIMGNILPPHMLTVNFKEAIRPD